MGATPTRTVRGRGQALGVGRQHERLPADRPLLLVVVACDFVVIAVCAPSRREASQWSEAVRKLVAAHGWPIGQVQVSTISGSGIAWLTCGEITKSKMLIPSGSSHSTGEQHRGTDGDACAAGS